MSVWKAFGAFAVEYLGMPSEAMPLYDSRAKWFRKARWIMAFILSVGNFGHNRDMSYFSKYPYVVRTAVSFGRRVGGCVQACEDIPVGFFEVFAEDFVCWVEECGERGIMRNQ